MRVLVSSLLTALFCSSAFATPPKPAHPQLLRYGELMRLSKEKRIAYLGEIRKLLVMLERPQAKYEVASTSVEDLKEQMAYLIRMADVLPQAAADVAVAAGDILPTWNPSRYGGAGGFECLPRDKASWVPELGACALKSNGTYEHHSLFGDTSCPEGSQELYLNNWVRDHKYCISQASWQQLGPANQERLNNRRLFSSSTFSGKSEAEARRIINAPVTASTPGNTSVESTNPAQAVIDASPRRVNPLQNAVDTASGRAARAAAGKQCDAPMPEACPVLSPAEEQAVIDRFKNSSAGSECIRGGFFGHYEGNKYRKGKCERDSAKYSNLVQGMKCKDKGTELCNPVVFCYGFDDKQGDKQEFKPGLLCTKVSQTFTADCEKSFREDKVSGKPKALVDAKKQPILDADGNPKSVTYRACDPATDVKLGTFQDEYTAMIEETKKSYDRLCAGSSEFKGKFCNECNAISAHIAKANCAASAQTASADGPMPAVDEGAQDSAR